MMSRNVHKPLAKTTSNQQGVGLIEVLIALIVMSIGFLAAANIQISSMRTNQLARLEAQALVLVGDMMDRMSSNPAGVAAGLYDDEETGTLTAPTCLATSCTPAQMASVDLFEWSANFESLLGDTNFVPLLPVAPDGSAAVGAISNPSATGLYTVSVTWQRPDGATTVEENVSVSFMP